jgi:3,4-dihydroxy 2-butanone 4-phosphate synthase/GTP cyclohydrolase II
MARRPQLEVFAARHGLRIGSIADLIRYRVGSEKTVTRVLDRMVHTAFGPFQLVVYQGLPDRQLHFALLRGDPAQQAAPLVRVQVADALVDLLQLDGPGIGLSLQGALTAVAAAGSGVVVVLHEAADSGELLARLQDENLGRRSAGEDGDWRRHGLGAQILRDLGLARIRVLGTPRRFRGLSGFGIEVVEYVPR